MATKFFPERLIFVPASAPHPPKAEYRCGFGREEWDQPAIIKKVQMVYGNKIAGRVSPSYPVNTYDEEAVKVAMMLLSLGKGNNNPNHKIVVTVAKLNGGKTLDKLIEEQEDFVHDFYLELAPQMTVVNVEFDNDTKLELPNNLHAFVFEVKFGFEQ